MRRMPPFLPNPLTRILLFISFAGILAGSLSCKSTKRPPIYPTPDTTTYVKKVSYNILFRENISLVQKTNAIENLKSSVRSFYEFYNKTYGTEFVPRFDSILRCPCDPSLYNLNFGYVDASGKSAQLPPPGGGMGGSGDIVESININYTISELPGQNYTDTGFTGRVNVKHIPVDPTKTLAIIDSGLDTTLFTRGIIDIMWKAPPGINTLYNFLPGQPVSNFFDSGTIKHGSAVTSLVIRAMDSSGAYPRLMILRALDKNDSGSIFSVSCALSYAIQNHATLVNASLGYMGGPDSILQHYIKLSDRDKENPVQLFFAAGNTPYPHDSLCSKEATNNLLTTGSPLFYPACYSPQYDNITSVTQVTGAYSNCQYQYFSNNFISLGVLNNADSCCSFKVDFSTHPYEGSSFATPVASGRKMTVIIKSGNTGRNNPMWRGLIRPSPSLTREGYIIHGKKP